MNRSNATHSYVSMKEPPEFMKTPYITAKKPTDLANLIRFCVFAKEPYTSAKEPSITAKQAYGSRECDISPANQYN